MANKIRFQHVFKRFKMYTKNSDKLLELFSMKKNIATHCALNDISFEVSEGDVIGIIGLNGSGKSTLSNLIAGVTIPTDGEVQINGTAALISISSGLNGQLTGYDNIELKGLMMGLSKKQIEEIRPKVIEFAELGKFIDQPVKVYSSGMKARLGFAISIHIDPDILVIDEALSVGDQTFTDRCLNKINEFKSKGKTIFFISHSLSQIKSFCDKAMWLHYGKLQEYDQVGTVINHYKDFLANFNKMTEQEKNRMREEYWENGKII